MIVVMFIQHWFLSSPLLSADVQSSGRMIFARLLLSWASTSGRVTVPGQTTGSGATGH